MINEKKEKQKDYYVDNKKFAEEYSIWKKRLLQARENGEPDPRITEYLGECILKICTRLTYSPKFYNYTWKDQFITNALENCIRYFDRFDETKISKRTGKLTAGPFSYFTTVAYWAFVRTILTEKNLYRIKQKYISNMSSVISEIRDYDSEDFDNEYVNYLKILLDDDFAQYDDKKMGKNKKHVDDLESDDILDVIVIDDDLAKEILAEELEIEE